MKNIADRLVPQKMTSYYLIREIGLAMIHAATKGYDKQVLEVVDIVKLALTESDTRQSRQTPIKNPAGAG